MERKRWERDVHKKATKRGIGNVLLDVLGISRQYVHLKWRPTYVIIIIRVTGLVVIISVGYVTCWRLCSHLNREFSLPQWPLIAACLSEQKREKEKGKGKREGRVLSADCEFSSQLWMIIFSSAWCSNYFRFNGQRFASRWRLKI